VIIHVASDPEVDSAGKCRAALVHLYHGVAVDVDQTVSLPTSTCMGTAVDYCNILVHSTMQLPCVELSAGGAGDPDG